MFARRGNAVRRRILMRLNAAHIHQLRKERVVLDGTMSESRLTGQTHILHLGWVFWDITAVGLWAATEWATTEQRTKNSV